MVVTLSIGIVIESFFTMFILIPNFWISTKFNLNTAIENAYAKLSTNLSKEIALEFDNFHLDLLESIELNSVVRQESVRTNRTIDSLINARKELKKPKSGDVHSTLNYYGTTLPQLKERIYEERR